MLGITTGGANIDLTCGFKSDINCSIGFVKATSGKGRHSCRDLFLFIHICQIFRWGDQIVCFVPLDPRPNNIIISATKVIYGLWVTQSIGKYIFYT